MSARVAAEAIGLLAAILACDAPVRADPGETPLFGGRWLVPFEARGTQAGPDVLELDSDDPPAALRLRETYVVGPVDEAVLQRWARGRCRGDLTSTHHGFECHRGSARRGAVVRYALLEHDDGFLLEVEVNTPPGEAGEEAWRRARRMSPHRVAPPCFVPSLRLGEVILEPSDAQILLACARGPIRLLTRLPHGAPIAEIAIDEIDPARDTIGGDAVAITCDGGRPTFLRVRARGATEPFDVLRDSLRLDRCRVARVSEATPQRSFATWIALCLVGLALLRIGLENRHRRS